MINIFAWIGIIAISCVITKLIIGKVDNNEEKKIFRELLNDFNNFKR